MTTQAVTDIKELVGESELGVCECTFNTCPERHPLRHKCGGSPRWMARVHAQGADGVHADVVVKMCDACLTATKAFTSARLHRRVCQCGIPVSKWVGPVMPL